MDRTRPPRSPFLPGDGRLYALLIALTICALAGTTSGFFVAFEPELAGTIEMWGPWYFPSLGVGIVLLVFTVGGYDQARMWLAIECWLLLVVQAIAFVGLVHRFGIRALAFVLVIAGNTVMLRLLHGPVRAFVARAERARKARFPDGVELVFAAMSSAILAGTLTLFLLAYDLREVGGPDLLGTTPLGRRVIPVVGLAIGIIAVARANRSRSMLYTVLGFAWVVSAAHLPLAGGCLSEESYRHSVLMTYALVVSAVGLAACTRARFKEFWKRYPTHASQASAAPIDASETRKRRKRTR